MLQMDVDVTNQDETGLVSMAKGGDDAAFEELIRRYHPKCKRLAASILRDSTEAEDVTQNCCLKAHRRLHQFKGESTFSAWLSRIVVNQARSVLSRRRRYTTISIEAVVMREQTPGGQPRVSTDLEQELGACQIRAILLREINLIPSIFRKTLILRDLREMPLAEIASELNLPVQTVKTRLFRGRKELRSRMLRHCGERGSSLLTARGQSFPRSMPTEPNLVVS